MTEESFDGARIFDEYVNLAKFKGLRFFFYDEKCSDSAMRLVLLFSLFFIAFSAKCRSTLDAG